MPQIIIYIVIGYIFNKTFYFVALKQNSKDIEHILTASLVIGFVYYKIANIIPFHISNNVDNILIIISALITSYLFARILRSKYLIPFLDFLKIRDTGNVYYWDDLMDNNYPMKIRIDYDRFVYEGMLHNFESYSNEPHLVLASYIIKDEHGNILGDYTNDNTRTIVLDISKSNKVEIIYVSNSEVCNDLKCLCDANNILYNSNKDEQES